MLLRFKNYFFTSFRSITCNGYSNVCDFLTFSLSYVEWRPCTYAKVIVYKIMGNSTTYVIILSGKFTSYIIILTVSGKLTTCVIITAVSGKLTTYMIIMTVSGKSTTYMIIMTVSGTWTIYVTSLTLSGMHLMDSKVFLSSIFVIYWLGYVKSTYIMFTIWVKSHIKRLSHSTPVKVTRFPQSKLKLVEK